jgi:WD40 repeat protein
MDNNNSNFKLTKIENKKIHDDYINSISLFPSGKIISVSADKSIKIWTNNFNLLQVIPNAHIFSIINIEIINEQNFITCSFDQTIKIWIKEENKFKIKDNILNAHKEGIIKVLYFKNILISCSFDKKIKLWEKNKENKYQTITIISNINSIRTIYLLEDKNIFISSGFNGTNFYNLNNLDNFFSIKHITCYNYGDTIKRIDNDRIIISSDNIIKIISISNKTIIKEIDNKFGCLGIFILKEKGLFFISGFSQNFKIYRCDNYECIYIEKDSHNNFIKGFVQINNCSIVSYSYDKSINIWFF